VSSTFNKTQGTSLLALQTVASGAVVLGSALDVSGKMSAMVGIHVGRTIATALTNPHKVRIEASTKSSLDGHWYPLAEFLTGIAASTTTATLTTGTTAGDKTLPMTTTTAIVVGDRVYIREAGAETNSEFGRVVTVNGGVSVVIEDGTLFSHTVTTTKVWSQAEMFVAQLDLSGVGRIRVVADSGYANVGQTVVCEAHIVTCDSFG
jgi:hypothetical protein